MSVAGVEGVEFPNATRMFVSKAIYSPRGHPSIGVHNLNFSALLSTSIKHTKSALGCRPWEQFRPSRGPQRQSQAMWVLKVVRWNLHRWCLRPDSRRCGGAEPFSTGRWDQATLRDILCRSASTSRSSAVISVHERLDFLPPRHSERGVCSTVLVP